MKGEPTEMRILKRCAFCRIMAARRGDYCSDGCRTRAIEEGTLGPAEHTMRLLGASPLVHVDPLYYAGIRHHGGHSSLEALGTLAHGRGRTTDSRGSY